MKLEILMRQLKGYIPAIRGIVELSESIVLKWTIEEKMKVN